MKFPVARAMTFLLLVNKFIVSRKIMCVSGGFRSDPQGSKVETILDNFRCAADDLGFARNSSNTAIDHWFFNAVVNRCLGEPMRWNQIVAFLRLAAAEDPQKIEKKTRIENKMIRFVDVRRTTASIWTKSETSGNEPAILIVLSSGDERKRK